MRNAIREAKTPERKWAINIFSFSIFFLPLTAIDKPNTEKMFHN